MASLIPIERTRKPPSSEPLTEREAAALFSAALNLFRRWGVNDEQGSIILDVPRRTYARWKAGEVGRISRDGQARLSILMGIHKALRTIFREPTRAYAWIKAPNAGFQGHSALEVMLGGEMADLMRVRRYLDAERGLW
jgi:uncharacterized protein (DUF2384 family)